MRLWQVFRSRLCFVLGHRYIGDAHRKLCVYCWKERVTPYSPPDGPDDPDH
ncbi:MAG: hypothetical protein OEY97_12495 [Nitrospirota bacterium]|nr:hypothetical protein [Nitrospirota bacterium]